MNLRSKLLLGFFSAIVFTVAVGVVAYVGISWTTQGITDITHQMEISKRANRALVDAQDAQAGTLRFHIYGDEVYKKIALDEAQNVIGLAQEAHDMMLSPKSRRSQRSHQGDDCLRSK